MAYYGQKSYQDKLGGGNGGDLAKYTIAQNGSLLVAFCNLLQRFGSDVNPAALNRLFTHGGVYGFIGDTVRDDLSWESIISYDDQLRITINNDAQGSWPSTNDAIVRFVFQSPKTGAEVEHYSLVADASKHTIIDSWDGSEHIPGYYGAPVAYAEYEAILPEQPVQPAKPGTTYTWVRGDRISMVAHRLRLSPKELLEHNDIDDPLSIQPGTVLHLPVVRDIKIERETRIEVLPLPVPMHVSKDGGCSKWAFGDMKTINDAKSGGFFPESTNLNIVGIAHVPITEVDGAEGEAAYYLDQHALGDYPTSGRLRWAVGFSWSDLSDGHVERTRPQPAVMQQTPPTLEGFSKPFVEQRVQDANDEGLHAYKLTYQPLDPPIPCTTIFPDGAGEHDAASGKRFIWVHEFDTRRPDRKLPEYWEGSIAGTFEHNGVFYGRPLGAKQAGLWYGIPLDLLQSNDDVYNTDNGQLTWFERTVVIPVARLAHSQRLARFRQRNKHNTIRT